MSEIPGPRPPIRDTIRDRFKNFMKKISKKEVPVKSSLTPETENDEQKLKNWLRGQGRVFWREYHIENPEQVKVIEDALNRLSKSMMSAAGNLGNKDMLEAAKIILTVTEGFQNARKTFQNPGGQENANRQQP